MFVCSMHTGKRIFTGDGISTFTLYKKEEIELRFGFLFTSILGLEMFLLMNNKDDRNMISIFLLESGVYW